MCLDGHCDGDGELFQISDTDIEGADAKQFSATPRIAMQADRGTPAAQLYHFHLAPGYAVDAGTEGFADGLLRGKAPCQSRCFAAALPYFRFGEDSLQETLAMTFEDLAHSLHFDNVDTYSDIDALGRA